MCLPTMLAVGADCGGLLVYAIWCHKCEGIMTAEMESNGLEKEKMKVLKQKLRVLKYLEETSRSIFERHKSTQDVVLKYKFPGLTMECYTCHMKGHMKNYRACK